MIRDKLTASIKLAYSAAANDDQRKGIDIVSESLLGMFGESCDVLDSDIPDSKKIKQMCVNDDFGLILNAAVRYAIGRQTYMPSAVIDYITPLLPCLDGRTLWCLERDIREQERYGETAYGDPLIDKPGWIRFLNSVRNEIISRKETGNASGEND